MKPGDRCPHCQKGKVYHQPQPGVLMRVVSQAALKATVYELEKLRCNLCSDVYTAKTPEGVGAEKYDETSASMIALLKYRSGLPFHCLELIARESGDSAASCDAVGDREGDHGRAETRLSGTDPSGGAGGSGA